MSFKHLLAGLLAAAMFLGTGGCGLHIGEKPAPTTIAFEGRGYSCVGEFPEHFDMYLKDQLSDAQITTFIRCVQRAFTSFAQLTRGEDRSVYSPEEIRSFVESFFLKRRHISDSLLAEMMVIKQVLVGGSAQQITRVELADVVDVLDELRREAIRLKPHLKVLNPKLALANGDSVLADSWERASEVLRQSIGVFSARLQKSPIEYSFAHLQAFLTEFREYVEWQKHFPEPSGGINGSSKSEAELAADWVAWWRAFKSATVSPLDPTGVRPAQWPPLLQSVARWYLAYVQYQVGVRPFPILRDVGLQNTFYFGQEVFSLIDEAIQRQPARILSFEQIMALADAGQRLGWIPAYIQMCGVERALKATVSRIFGDPSTPWWERQETAGLSLIALNSMRTDFFRWAYLQMDLDAFYHSPQVQLKTDLPNLNGVIPLQARDLRPRVRGVQSGNWAELMKLKERLPHPLFSENADKFEQPQAGGTRAFMVGPQDFEKYGLNNGFNNLSAINLSSALVSLLFRGYAQDGIGTDRFQTGIHSYEMQTFYRDFRDLGIDLGIIDKRGTSAGSRAFIEGNLFTYSADGIRQEPPPRLNENGEVVGGADDPRSLTDRLGSEMTMVEAVEYFNFMYSGGGLAGALWNSLLDACAPGHDKPGFHYADGFDGMVRPKPYLKRTCVQRVMAQAIEKSAYNLPGLVTYLAGLSEGQRVVYGQTLLATAFSPVNSKIDLVEYQEVQTIAVVLQYAEAVMTRYDLNHDGQLTDAEILGDGKSVRAEDVFVGLIQKYAKEINHLDLSEAASRGVFRYILDYNEIPEGGVANYGQIQWLARFPPSLSLDRLHLAGVFKVIISKILSAPPAAIKNKAAATCH